MKKLNSQVLSYLISNKKIEKNEIVLYEYSLNIFMHAIVNFIITMVIGIVVGMLKEAIILYFSFLLIRKFSGGLHMKSYITCVLVSSVLFIFALLAIKYLEENKLSKLFYVTIFLLSIVIIVFAPLENINKILSNKEKIIYKATSIIIIISFITLSTFLINKKKSIEYGYSIGMAIVLDGLLLLLGRCFSN